MKLRQLSCLVAIVDNSLNVTRAANLLCTSQPGVSKQIILLEEELRLKLFERRGRSLRGVTTAGEQIIAHARVIMNEVDNIRAMAQRHRSDPAVLSCQSKEV